MKREELLGHPELLKEYVAWVNSDMTRRVISILKEESSPLAPAGEITRHSSSWCNGHFNGMWHVLRMMVSLHLAAGSQESEATYGTKMQTSSGHEDERQ